MYFPHLMVSCGSYCNNQLVSCAVCWKSTNCRVKRDVALGCLLGEHKGLHSVKAQASSTPELTDTEVTLKRDPYETTES